MITVSLERSAALQRLTGQPAALVRRAGILAAKRAAEDYTEAVLDYVGGGHAFTPRTGRAEQETGWRPRGDGAEVYSNAPYAGYLEFGTQPHLIKPKPGRKALRFFAGGPGGGQIIRRSVQHPGTAPRPFFFADWPRRESLIQQAAREAVAEVLLGGGRA